MTAGSQPERARAAAGAGPLVIAPLAWAALGALLILLLSQIPARHQVAVGGFDAAYTQGFFDPERPDDPGGARPYLAGATGGARWSGASAALIFPQAGLPGEVSVRLRGWRADGPPPEVTLLLNGVTELERFTASGAWEERRVPIRGGWRKATDFFVEVRADTTRLADGREVGVLVDHAVYRVGPGLIVPYPAQLVYAAAVGGLLWVLLRPHAAITRGAAGRFRGTPASYLLAYGVAWLLLYRLQPPLYPYPLRALPPLTVLALAGALVVRDGPALAARLPRLASVLAPVVVIAGWTGATLLLARGHVTLSRPGVENDFRVFATRATLAQVFSADGFYNLGYPLLLWLTRPFFAGNAFLAGRVLAALSGAVLLAAGYWLARCLLPPGPAFVALLALALNGLVVQYGLYVGSDMPFAACAALASAALVATLTAPEAGTRRRIRLATLAGLCGGLAFLMRHPGLLLLPWGVVVLLLAAWWRSPAARAGRYQPVLAFGAAFLLAMLPQLIVNTAQAGQPLYNQQAKNIWLAVYGNTDWGRWEEAPNDIGLAEVVLRDPARFGANWWRNVVGYTGSGAEDTSEFGRAIQLRLLGWPANWLAAAGLLGWLLLLLRTRRPAGDGHALVRAALLMLIAGYVAAVSTAFALQRFFLPLAPIYAVAAGWCLWQLTRDGRALLATSLVLVVVLWGGYGAGARSVLAQQPADEVAAVRLVEAATAPGDLIAARVSGRLPLAKYSAIAHRVVDWPAAAQLDVPVTPADLAAARAAGASYLLWDEATGPPPLPDPATALVRTSGRYGLYRLDTNVEGTACTPHRPQPLAARRPAPPVA